MSALVSLDAPRWNWRTPTWHALLYLVTFLLATLALALPVGIGYFVFNLLRGSALEDITRHLEDSLLYLNVIVAAGQLLAAVALTVVWMRWIDRRGTLAELGWRWRGARVGLAFACGLGMSALALAGYAILGGLSLLGLAWQAESLNDVLFVDLLGFIPLLMLTVTAEELMFRGYIRWVFPEKFAPFASAALYAIFRVIAWRWFGDTSTQGTLTLVLVGISSALAGIVLVWAWGMTRSLWTPISLRLGWAFLIGLIFSLPINGNTVEGLLLTRTGGGLITGGAGGPEAGVVGVLVWLAVCVLVWRWRQRAQPNASSNNLS